MAAENFFSRWSRRKQQGDADPLMDEQAGHGPRLAAAVQENVAQTPLPATPAPTAADLDQLTLESDYAGFMGTEVDAALRRAAMKKLFFDPQLSVMDGLDIYIDDYNKTTPIPAAMLAALEQAKSFLAPAEEGGTEAPSSASHGLEPEAPVLNEGLAPGQSANPDSAPAPEQGQETDGLPAPTTAQLATPEPDPRQPADLTARPLDPPCQPASGNGSPAGAQAPGKTEDSRAMRKGQET